MSSCLNVGIILEVWGCVSRRSKCDTQESASAFYITNTLLYCEILKFEEIFKGQHAFEMKHLK